MVLFLHYICHGEARNVCTCKCYQKVKAQLSNPYKSLSVQINFKFPIFAMTIFWHFFITIAICYGCNEKAEITMAKFWLFGSQNRFYRLESWDSNCWEHFCPSCVASCHVAKYEEKKHKQKNKSTFIMDPRIVVFVRLQARTWMLSVRPVHIPYYSIFANWLVVSLWQPSMPFLHIAEPCIDEVFKTNSNLGRRHLLLQRGKAVFCLFISSCLVSRCVKTKAASASFVLCAWWTCVKWQIEIETDPLSNTDCNNLRLFHVLPLLLSASCCLIVIELFCNVSSN